jgi:hypothetical protein
MHDRPPEHDRAAAEADVAPGVRAARRIARERRLDDERDVRAQPLDRCRRAAVRPRLLRLVTTSATSQAGGPAASARRASSAA